MKKRFKRICIVDTVYTLFLYLLISTEDDINKTFFFWSAGIPTEIRRKYKYQSYYIKPNDLKDSAIRLFYLKFTFLKIFRWTFLRNKHMTYWGHSHLRFSAIVIGRNKLNMIEDGVGNYSIYNIRQSNRLKWLKNLILGPYHEQENIWGINSNCENIYLTGLMEIPKAIKHKVRLINTIDLWLRASEFKKNYILNIYNIEKEDIEMLSNKTNLLITQCFSEDGDCSEITKIGMYRDIISCYCNDMNDLIIKPHPRETTDYSIIFPKATIYKKRIPLEILLIAGAKIKRIITINSTAAYSSSNNTEMIILGRTYYEKYKNNNNK